MTELGQSASWVGDEQAEIDKIMSEIEQLEKEMQSNDHSANPQGNAMTGSGALSAASEKDTGDVSLEETLSQLPIEETSFSPETPFSASSQPSALSLALSGPMIFKFTLESTQQEVTLEFSEQFLQIELPDGSQLKMPLQGKKSLRKVA